MEQIKGFKPTLNYYSLNLQENADFFILLSETEVQESFRLK